MFDKIPALFNRQFAVGFFLPTAIFLAATTGLLFLLGYYTPTEIRDRANQFDLLIGTAVWGLFAWGGGTILLALNREGIRFLEGYGHYNPLKVFSRLEKRRFSRVVSKLEELDKVYVRCEEAGEDMPLAMRRERNELIRKKVEQFPDQEQFLLPTPYGNALRSFEVYPRVMYGIDAIPGWPRLLAVIPESYLELIDDAKSIMNFWINVVLLGGVFIIAYAALAYPKGMISIWIPLATIIVIAIAYSRAIVSAIAWGNMVRSAFDVFLPELGNKLRFEIPIGILEEQKMWRQFVRSVMSMRPDERPDRKVIPPDTDGD